ncbi:hypothetical protein CR513_24700, partial [Mucuna pruriens]
MYQGSTSIEEYFKEMEVTLMRSNVLESNEPQRDLTPTILAIERVRMKRKNVLGRTMVQRRGVPYHEAKRKKLHHLTLVLHTKATTSSALSA